MFMAVNMFQTSEEFLLYDLSISSNYVMLASVKDVDTLKKFDSNDCICSMYIYCTLDHYEIRKLVTNKLLVIITVIMILT